MATYDLGDKVYLSWSTVDSSGAAVNPGTVTATVTLPDATSVSLTTATSTLGSYTTNYTPTQVGRHVFAWTATGAWPQAYNDVFTVRDINDIGIVSLDDAKYHLNIPITDVSQDAELSRIIDAAADLSESYVGIVLGRRTYTNELYDGNTEFICLRSPKAISITSVYENGALLNSGQYVLDPTGQRLYRVGSGTLYATNSYGYWSGGMNNIKVTYVSGWVNPPAAAKQGVLEVIRHLWQTQRGSMSVLGRNLAGDETYQTPTYSLPRRAMELLDPVSLPGIA